MKSPWKFLAELTSRKRRADDLREDNANDGTADREPVPAGAVHAAKASDDIPDPGRIERVSPPAGEMAPDGVREDSGRKAISPSEQIVTGQAAEQWAVSKLPTTDRAAVQPAQPARIRQGHKAKTHRSRETVKSAVPISEGEQPQTPTRIRSFVQEMAELDQEIMDLRRQLSQKLHKQNAELRAMLDRFNQS